MSSLDPLSTATPGAAAPPLNADPQVRSPALATSLETLAVTETHQPKTMAEPITVVTGLRINNSALSEPAPAETQALAVLAERLTVCLRLDQAVLDRLFLLWNTLLQLGADEIGDWSLQAICEVTSPDESPVPHLLGVAATVYASGEVSCAVSVDGIDPALWFVEMIDLADFELDSDAGHNRADQLHGASA